MRELPEPVMPGQMEFDFGEMVELGQELESVDDYCIPCGGRCKMFDPDEEDCD